MSSSSMPSAGSEPMAGNVNRYITDGRGQIFRIPVYVFPGLWGYVYVVLVENYRVLIDTGSGYGDSIQHLEAGLETASDLAGVDVTLPNLTQILITHGHIDHFGGLSYVRPLTSAKLGIHALDRRVVTHHVERLSIVTRRLEEFLAEAGVSPEKRGPILDMYKIWVYYFISFGGNRCAC